MGAKVAIYNVSIGKPYYLLMHETTRAYYVALHNS